MCMASRAVLPSAPVLVKRSEPARSTRLSLLAHATPSARQGLGFLGMLLPPFLSQQRCCALGPRKRRAAHQRRPSPPRA